MLQHYDPKLGQRLFPDINLKYVNGFDIYLQKRGNKGNTRKYYLKALRAILNRAIQEREASNDTYPFGKGKFEIAKLEEVTAKRYLSSDTFEMIKSTQAHNPQAEYARQLFPFLIIVSECHSSIWPTYLRIISSAKTESITSFTSDTRFSINKKLFQFIFSSMNQFRHS